jgi:hypothetical protein
MWLDSISFSHPEFEAVILLPFLCRNYVCNVGFHSIWLINEIADLSYDVYIKGSSSQYS